MTYAGFPYGGVGYAGSDVASIPTTDTTTTLAVEWSPTTGALETPVWVDITTDVRSWNTSRGRNRELERFQPGRATIVLSNLDRQYDSVYTAGPNYGNIKPMRRIRIRETFNGVTYPVFDGFVDKWKLDYPNVGRDATATVTATDAMKVLARTDLPVSVYDRTVRDDAPEVYWRLDETKNADRDALLLALNSGSLGSTADGTYVGPPDLAGERLVVKDPGTSMVVTNSEINPGTLEMGVIVQSANFALLGGDTTSFVVEAWCLPRALTSVLNFLWEYIGAGPTGARVYGSPGAALFFQVNTTTAVYLATSANTPVSARFHVVAKYVSGQKAQLWVNGALTESVAVTAGTIAAGSALRIGYRDADANHDENFAGSISHVAIWRGTAAEAFGATQVAAHYAAGAAPWQSDLPGARLGRVLDLAAWPSASRELDAGATTLQSADIAGQSVLEHAQKVGETEFGLLFITRDGKVRLISRQAMFDRVPDGTVYGDLTGEVGYTNFEPDDGDDVIRNRAIISRLNGVAQTVEDAASIDAYGPFEYVLDGLLHSSDQYSKDYAQTIVGEYGAQRRRITSLTMGPPISGLESTVYPAMLGRELGDYIRVRSRPVGGGTLFEQVCAVEGIVSAGAPGGVRTTRFILSPMLGEDWTAMAWAAWTPTLANLTLGNGTVTARYVRAGNTIVYRFKFKLGSTSAVGVAPTFTLPVAPAADYVSQEDNSLGVVSILDSGAALYTGGLRFDGGSTVQVFAVGAGGTYAGPVQITSLIPMTWAVSDCIVVNGTYEAA